MSDSILTTAGQALTRSPRRDYHYDPGEIIYACQHGAVRYDHALRPLPPGLKGKGPADSVEPLFPRAVNGAREVARRTLRRIHRRDVLQKALNALMEDDIAPAVLGADAVFAQGDVIETARLIMRLAGTVERTDPQEDDFRKAIHLLASEMGGYIALQKKPENLTPYYANGVELIRHAAGKKAKRPLRVDHFLDCTTAERWSKPAAVKPVKEPKIKLPAMQKTRRETQVFSAASFRLIKREGEKSGAVATPAVASTPTVTPAPQAALPETLDVLAEVSRKNYSVESVFGAQPQNKRPDTYTAENVFGSPHRPKKDAGDDADFSSKDLG